MGLYPFQLSATSLTIPTLNEMDNLEVNRQLGLKEVEVTLEFPRSLPVPTDLKQKMLEYQEKYEFSYTIHLPLSMHMTDVNPYVREASLQTLKHIFAEIEELAPRAYVLHVSPFYYTGGTPLGRPFEVQLHEDRWKATYDSLSRLAQMIDPRKIAIENLFHDLIFQDEFIREFDYSVCMDVGHLLLNKSDIYLFYYKYRDRIKVIHLHDVVHGQDHQQLGEPGSTLDLQAFFYLLRKDGYTNTIVLEQFKPEHIRQSLQAIDTAWNGLSLHG